jgi:ketosteroid isomerase-like protein
MSQPPVEVVSDLYAAFGRGDIPAILAMIDEDIDWRAPENLPHGGSFLGREAVGHFFRGIGEHWEDLRLDLEGIVSGGDRVIALARIHGRLRATGDEARYSSAHAWTVRDGVPVRFAEYVDAPVTLPTAHAATT